MTARKVAELDGAELDCAVAKAMGMIWAFVPTDPEFGFRRALCVAECTPNPHIDGFPVFAPSTQWEHGGPIIHREMIGIACYGNQSGGYIWRSNHNQFGPTPLIAAMRAYVASRFGETVELP